MDLTPLLDNKYAFGIAAGFGGVFLTLITQQILSRRGLFTYFVNHIRVGVSEDDAIFGSVRLTWNNNAIKNLFLSTTEMVNESTKDFESVIVRAFTNDAVLLTERTEIVGTTHILEWTNDFKKKLEVKPGQLATDDQIKLHSHQREYVIPVMNRGQIVRFHFLNSATTEKQPSIWLDVLHKGVKLKFRTPQTQFFGVPQPQAALVGAILGFVFVGTIIMFINSVWIAALISLFYGFIVLIPGAGAIRAWRWLRDFFGG